ncbi:SUMF1/EgtB/PvdO family nonheme iron enzyme [Candidatus Eisenbacteria bacterium]|uniref:SUMF1/EgtB/PvdO family nonheme iron enzyme n=1 Tax=Eiseniibacteriota bacterium TaxID=2212470 RepID=A0ABV6YM78_UNCEI
MRRTVGWLGSDLAGVVLLVMLVCFVSSCRQSEQESVGVEAPEPEMVMIPSGEFVMGHEGNSDFSPPHTVRIDPFFMDKYEVTNAQYLAFCEETGRKLPDFWGIDSFRCGADYLDHPVIGVAWSDANAYARWRGVRLPTEAEWEYAARGGLVGKNYSHGDEHDSTLYVKAAGEKGPRRIGLFPPNGFGLHDMTGNVCEWVQDRFDEGYYAVSPDANPTGPGHARFRVIRGGGWHTGPYCSRVYFRSALASNWVDFNVGFRCAKYKGESAALGVEEILKTGGIEEALSAYRRMRAAEPGAFYYDESEFNDAGYRLVADSLYAAAVEILRLNTEAFPRSYNAFDSLGEAYKFLGDRRAAIRNYRKSLELYPGNSGARQMLEELGAEG